MSKLLERAWAELPRRIVTRLRVFGPANAGVAAVEFALILPVMIAMYLGMTEITIGINTNRKLTLLSRSLADLTSRMTTITATEMSNVFAAATAVMQPYDAANVSMAVTSVLVKPGPSGTFVGEVDWSCKRGPSPATHAKGSAYPVPDGFESSQSFVLVETSLNYMPMFGGRFLGKEGALLLDQTTPWPVRTGTQVTWQGGACA